MQQNSQARVPSFGCASMPGGPRSGSFPNLGVNPMSCHRHYGYNTISGARWQSVSTVTTTISSSLSHTRTRTTLHTLAHTTWIHSYYASTSCKQAAPLPCRRYRKLHALTQNDAESPVSIFLPTLTKAIKNTCPHKKSLHQDMVCLFK